MELTKTWRNTEWEQASKQGKLAGQVGKASQYSQTTQCCSERLLAQWLMLERKYDYTMHECWYSLKFL